MIGKSMAELKFSQKYKVIVILMEYEGIQHTPMPMRPFEKGDRMWVLGHVEDMDKLVEKNGVSGLIDMKDINLPGAPQ